MAFWEIIFYWVALVAYALAAGGFIYSFVFKNPRAVPKVTLMVAFGFLAQTTDAAGAVVRGDVGSVRAAVDAAVYRVPLGRVSVADTTNTPLQLDLALSFGLVVHTP